MKVASQELVLAIVLNYNQNDYTVSCVNSLLDSNYNNLMILLLDNGSLKNNYLELESRLPRDNRLITERIVDNLGYAKGSNYAMELGLSYNPKYFLIMNNDTIVDKDAVQELVNTSKLYNDKARVTGKVFHYDNKEMLQFIAFKYNNKKLLSFQRMGVDEMDIGQYDHLTELDMVDDIFVLHPVELFKQVGGYSQYLWVNGVNIDISLRALESGYKLVFSPKAKIWHKGSVSIGGRNKNPKLAFWNIQSKLILRYTYLNSYTFSKIYIKILFEAIRTYTKSVFLKCLKGKDQMAYAKSKFKAIQYFNKWVRTKNINTGFNPYN